MSNKRMVRGFSETGMKKWSSKRGYTVENAFLKELRTFFFSAEDYIPEKDRPQNFKTDAFIYEVNATMCGDDRTVTINTYHRNGNKKGKLLCSEYLHTMKMLYKNALRTYVIVETVGGEKRSKGLIARSMGSSSIEGWHITLMNGKTRVPGFVVVTKYYTLPFIKTEMTPVKSKDYPIASIGMEYRKGRYHYEQCPLACYDLAF